MSTRAGGSRCPPGQRSRGVVAGAPLRPRRARRRPGAARAARGFGKAAPDAPPKGAGGGGGPAQRKGFGGGRRDRRAEDLLKEVERLEGVAPIDPAQAGRGRADFVRVKDWKGGRGEVGDLELEQHLGSVQARQVQGPLFPQLVLQLQQLEQSGELAIANDAELPPFERWAFRPGHYHQYLRDLAAVHEALEASVAGLCSSAVPHAGAKVIGTFHAAFGVSVAAALAADLAALEVDLEPTQQTRAFADYLRSLGRRALSEEAGASDAACYRLFTNLFAVYVSHFTSFNNVVKAADEKLGLRDRGAFRAFSANSYVAEGDPVKVFSGAINACGKKLPDGAELEIGAELPRAIKKTTLLVTTLAKVE